MTSRGLLIGLTMLGATTAGAQTLTVRNNHTLPYAGAVEIAVRAPDGAYAGSGATGVVRNGVARLSVALPAGGSVVLRRGAATPNTNRFAVAGNGGALALTWAGRALGAVDFDLAVRAGTTGTTDEAVRAFAALPLAWKADVDGTLRAATTRDGWSVAIAAVPYGVGALDVKATLVRTAPEAGSQYVALVRRVSTPNATGAQLRFNGRTFATATSPDTWDRDFWYVRGVDWLTWKTPNARVAIVNGFTPVPTVQKKDSLFGEGSHFWVWERTRASETATFLVSEVSGPNAEQGKSTYMPVTPYAPVRQGDTISLRWRLAVADAEGVLPDSAWAESQLRGYASYRMATGAPNATIDLGVRSVAFGTSFFPYSTYPENFDYARTPQIDREVWWAFSPTMWAKWKTFVPQMRTDFHVIRAMGFSFVRLHHLELLQQMPRAEAVAFLDFYFAEARALGLKVLVDTEGPDEWIRQVTTRYAAGIARVEVENEVLLYGVKPSDVARLAREAKLAKASAPNAQVFMTSAGNNGVFERLRHVDMPMDRIGLHAYKHGPQWMEAYGSHVLGTADYAANLGKAVTLGEFNWKSFGRLDDAQRAPLVRQLYETVLAPRAIPELFEFHFAETQSINTMLARDGTRHYEPLMLDRRPKPEALEIMRIIREQSAPEAPVRALPITVSETHFYKGNATSTFTVTNGTTQPVTVKLSAVAFDPSLRSGSVGSSVVHLRPGATHTGTVTLTLAPNAKPGTYHHFVRAEYGTQTSWGWGIASHIGAPTFAKGSVIGDNVRYPQGASVVDSIDWTRPIAVAYADSAPVLELESAYTLANTLQAATGRRVWLSSVGEVPDSLVARGTLVIVGQAARAQRLGGANEPLPTRGPAPKAKTYTTADAPGTIAVRRSGGRASLLVGGVDGAGTTPGSATLAAASELVLRFWPHAKDAAIAVTGTEPGAATGKRAGKVTNADLP